MNTQIDGVLLGSPSPARLQRWYTEHLSPTVDVDGFMIFGHADVLANHRPHLPTRALEPHRVIINYRVPNIHQVVEHLKSVGTPVVADLEYREAGLWFATFEDPDGNYLQLIEQTPTYWINKREREGAVPSPLDGASVAVRLPASDLARARQWYATCLGLEPMEERSGGLRYQCGGTAFVVFASQGAASGNHTQMSISVENLDHTMSELQKRGVRFDKVQLMTGHYPSTGATGERATWFRDSEHNLIGLSQLTFD